MASIVEIDGGGTQDRKAKILSKPQRQHRVKQTKKEHSPRNWPICSMDGGGIVLEPEAAQSQFHPGDSRNATSILNGNPPSNDLCRTVTELMTIQRATSNIVRDEFYRTSFWRRRTRIILLFFCISVVLYLILARSINMDFNTDQKTVYLIYCTQFGLFNYVSFKRNEKVKCSRINLICLIHVFIATVKT